MLLSEIKKDLYILKIQLFKLFYSKYFIFSFLLFYSFLPLMITLEVFIYAFILYFCILSTLIFYKCATLSTLSLSLRVSIQVCALVFYWGALLLLYSLLSMFFFGENTTLKLSFMVISLVLPLVFALNALIESMYEIIDSLNKIKVTDFKKTFTITIIFIVLVVLLTDIVFSIIYSSVILLGDVFGYLTNKPNFTEIKKTFNTKTIEAFYNIFYFTFSIHYAIPFTGDSIFTKLQELVNKSSVLSIIQIVHVLFAKAIDLLILGLVANKFFNFSKKKKRIRNYIRP
ncbi:hypothetical protein ASG16_023020 [Brevibacillus sp. Leaf182]|nr:hypothetical protein ASG16_023020 [Brevibacillus sp. Leaf182]